MSFEIYKGGGLTGLANLGNTCYINSCIQVLSHSYEFQNKLSTLEDPIHETVEGNFLKEYISLRDIMWKSNCKIAPGRFLKVIHLTSNHKDRDIFTGFAQQDLPEFLLFIIDCFHTGIKKKMQVEINGKIKTDKDKINKECYNILKHTFENEYSAIYDLFYGMYVTNIYSLDGKKLSFKPDPFLILDLPIPHTKKNITIYDCFDLFCNKELLSGENAWYDDKSKQKRDAEKSIVFWKLPTILIVCLKRFTNENKKLHNLVDVPLKDFDLKKYMIYKDSQKYNLFGICNHHGSSGEGGHYTSHILTADNKWYNFNDTQVKSINEEKVISPSGYCFFFRKKT